MVTVRLAHEDDLARLPGIERAAGEVFRSLGMDAVADDELPTVEELGRYQQAGRVIVGDDNGRVVAYLLLGCTKKLDPRLGSGCTEWTNPSMRLSRARNGSEMAWPIIVDVIIANFSGRPGECVSGSDFDGAALRPRSNTKQSQPLARSAVSRRHRRP
jgi:hypothetical protein